MRQFFFFLITASACTAARAQLYNNGTLYIGSSGVLFVNGSFTNTAFSDYRNNGTVYITGNISNSQASMPAGTGTVYFNGDAAQTLSGSAPFRNLNVNLDNASGLTLANRLAIGDGVDGLLTFTAGTITSGTASQDVYFYPGSSYTGFDSSHHIIGYVTKSGSTDFDFPIGTGAHPADIGLTELSGNADFQVLYTGSGYGRYNTEGTLTTSGVFSGEWWSVAETSGTSSARITLKWDDARKPLNHSEPAALVVARFADSVWTSAAGIGGNPGSDPIGSIGPSNVLNSFGAFTFGSTAVALPIVLSAFTVTDQGCKAYLTWMTSVEQNAVSFDVQQSTDGATFNTIGSVMANDAPSTYHATVAQTAEQAFYRVRLVNLDGTSIYSGIDELKLSCLTAADRLVIYPNPLPARGTAQVNLTSSVLRGSATLQVFDERGSKVYSEWVIVNKGVNQYTLPAAGLAKGVYLVRVAGNSWKSDVIRLSRD